MISINNKNGNIASFCTLGNQTCSTRLIKLKDSIFEKRSGAGPIRLNHLTLATRGACGLALATQKL
jgi:hypothetical protein